jgi:peptidoglycan/LPS O-acetylase OafA/YrhL
MRRGDRLTLLDGYRGVAAIVVLLYHITLDTPVWMVQHGYLAVDFFFCLSGLVIASAYEEKLKEGMSVGRFLLIRVQRLYPLISLGAICAALVSIGISEPGRLAILTVRSALLIPSGLSSANPHTPLITVNFIAWSLLFELTVNLIYCTVIRYLNNKLLCAIILGSLICVFVLATEFHSLNFGPKRAHGITGVFRAMLSFFMGVALLRVWKSGVAGQLRSPPALGAAVLIACMLPVDSKAGWVVPYDLAIVVVLFPALILAAANTQLSGWQADICEWIGKLSYPIYVMQYPAYMLAILLSVLLPTTILVSLLITAAVVVMHIAFASIVLHRFDEPVQAWLRRWAGGQAVPAMTVR